MRGGGIQVIVSRGKNPPDGGEKKGKYGSYIIIMFGVYRQLGLIFTISLRVGTWVRREKKRNQSKRLLNAMSVGKRKSHSCTESGSPQNGVRVELWVERENSGCG